MIKLFFLKKKDSLAKIKNEKKNTHLVNIKTSSNKHNIDIVKHTGKVIITTIIINER